MVDPGSVYDERVKANLNFIKRMQKVNEEQRGDSPLQEDIKAYWNTTARALNPWNGEMHQIAQVNQHTFIQILAR